MTATTLLHSGALQILVNTEAVDSAALLGFPSTDMISTASQELWGCQEPHTRPSYE